MNTISYAICAAAIAAGGYAAYDYFVAGSHDNVSDTVIAEQRAALAASTAGAGFGPQSPRDIDAIEGVNAVTFDISPTRTTMNLCNIHFHENAEHKGGEFTTYAGNGDGHGYGTGFKYDGELAEAELAPVGTTIGASDHGDLVPGDTIEIHFVHSSAAVSPGPTLGACVSDDGTTPQLRVDTVVAVLVNETSAANFLEMAKIEQVGDLYQVTQLPTDLGTPVVYAGSTTGPGYNEEGSPYKVTWSVSPKVIKLDINSLATWLSDNPFDEDHAHGVRNLVLNKDLLSPITN
ncbi:delta-class carbonic anhydrase [Actibacterium lipolyticum]|uniref:Cadmium carbonic anhydrase n=1 Tax=Actibacterium lipolyticum TaxID=1524263 RepID=A0A238JJR4_9RHOB|nr:delta-class carbonic anhydrase [Actibacterium lipolyticum]SMX30725.1 hypothetical protein COL8621_00086 [Actibacterium lipolyticum]